MKKWILGLFLLAALGAAAQDLRVEYTEGLVELASGGSWKELAPGDRLPVGARIRLAEDAFVELAQGSTRFAVSQPGVYLAAATGERELMSAATARVITGLVTPVGTTATAGRTRMLVIYTDPTVPTAATYAAT